MRSGFRLNLIFLLLLIGLLISVSFYSEIKYKENKPYIISGDSNLQKNTFSDFLGVNSVRENKKSWIHDQYSVATNHRIFGMDSYVFSGEEIVTNKRGAYFKIDRSIPHDEYPSEKIGFNPSKGANGFNFDKFLSEMKSEGYNSIPVLAKNLLYNNISSDSLVNMWQLPYDDHGNAENPMDYKSFSSFLFQFTARYGGNKLEHQGGTIDTSALKLAQNNEIKAGLDLIFAIEPGNEMDKSWFSEKEQASPKEMAAFLSAAFDGHMRLMGEGYGILQADPKMKILFPSPVDIKYDYVRNVMDELINLRKDAELHDTKVLPLNNLIFTAHFYPFKNETLHSKSTIVEKTSFLDKSYEFVAKLREKFNCPIYLTEIGYDKVTGNISPIGVPLTEHEVTDDMDINSHAHAKHILRLIFTAYASGYDKAYLFSLKDPILVGDKNYRTKYATSGLIRKNGKKDEAWYLLKYLSGRLKDFRLTYAFINQPINFLCMENDYERAYIYWLGSNNDDSLNYNFPIFDNNATPKGELINLSEFSVDQELSQVCLNLSDSLALEINEFPRLLIVSK